ncbi:kelch-like protein 20 [Dendronephthya gigantea]|uniref:kelch-like protein 20 n=1 Tax=Dendronephthya gigantea TaxID=151771 RepID=UPI00106D7FAA|nr:kelch-like protein 20 [Dendronephthya gigantea]
MEETATEKDQNVFSSPWDGSDIILVVEDQEFHVHKWILTSQSPVFKAMLDGRFMEASQDKITLKDKDLKVMEQFLKLLYPWSMFEEDKVSFDDKNFLLLLALADKYQCVNLIKQCINKVKITSENALQILPFALKYHQAVLHDIYDTINWSAPTDKLKEELLGLENKDVLIEILLTKCCFLEASAIGLHNALMSLMGDFINIKTKGRGGVISDSRCNHTINVQEINKTKSCVHCKENYKEKFLNPILGCQSPKQFFNILEKGYDVATAVAKEKKKSL